MEKQIEIEKEMIVERLEQVVDKVAVIERAIDVVETTVNREVPVIIHKDKTQEVPVIIEQLTEKVILMPQVVEVLKYVHEVLEKDYLGPALEGESSEKQYQLNVLSGNLR